MQLLAWLSFVAFYFVVGTAAHAGSRGPELDAGTLSALTSSITGAYVAFRLYRARHSK